jgi:hypothetical protein
MSAPLERTWAIFVPSPLLCIHYERNRDKLGHYCLNVCDDVTIHYPTVMFGIPLRQMYFIYTTIRKLFLLPFSGQ